MDYNEITSKFGGTLDTTNTKSTPTITADELTKQFGGRIASPSDIYFGNTLVVGGPAAKILSGEKGLGETIASTANVLSKDYSNAVQSQVGLSDLQSKVLREISAKKSRGEDTSHLENILNRSNTAQELNKKTLQDISQASQKSTGQVAGELGQTALDVLSAGSFKPIAQTFKLAKTAEEANKVLKAEQALSTGQKLKNVALNTFKRLGIATPLGYGYDVSSNLQEGKTGTEALKPGYATLFSTAIPLTVGGYEATKVLSKPFSEYLVGNFSGKGVEAAKRYGAGGQDFAGITPTQVLNDTRKSLALYDNSVSNAFGATKKDLIDKFTGSRIGLEQQNAIKIRQIATDFGFGDRLPNNLGNMSVKETMDLLGEINSKGRTKISPLDSPAIRTAKYQLSQLKDVIKNKAIKEFGGTGGEFEKAYSSYSKAQRVITDMENVVGSISKYKTLSPTQINTAYSRLQRLFNQDSAAYIDAVKSFESVTGERILDKVAASQFSELVPKALKTGDNTISAFMNDVFSFLTFPLRSPKIGSYLISLTSGYKPSVVTSLLNSNPQVRKLIYDAVVKDNKSLDEAITNVINKYNELPNKQGGFIRFGENQNKSLMNETPAKIQAKTTSAKSPSPIKPTMPSKKDIIINNDNMTSAGKQISNKDISIAILSHADEIEQAMSQLSKNGKLNLDGLMIAENLKNLKDGDITGEEARKIYEMLAMHNRQDIVQSINNQIINESKKALPIKNDKLTNNLLEQAKKYKTAEEFVKAQGTPVYHGTVNPNITELKAGTKGGDFGNAVYLTNDKNVAKTFTDYTYSNPNYEAIGGGKYQDINTGKIISGKTPTIIEVTLDKNTKLANITEAEYSQMVEKYRKPNGSLDIDNAHKQINETYKKLGYDGLNVKATKEYNEPQIVIFEGNESKIKTKSQLTDIWNKANKK